MTFIIFRDKMKTIYAIVLFDVIIYLILLHLLLNATLYNVSKSLAYATKSSLWVTKWCLI